MRKKIDYLISSLPGNNPEHRHEWIYLIKSPSSTLSACWHLDRIRKQCSVFLMLSNSCQDFYTLYISSGLTCICLCPKSNTLTGCKQKNSSGIPWFKKRLHLWRASFLEGTQFSRNSLNWMCLKTHKMKTRNQKGSRKFSLGELWPRKCVKPCSLYWWQKQEL